MNKKIVGVVLATVILAFFHLAEAQQPKKIPRIGFLSSNPSFASFPGFRQGLRELGYVEGKNIIIEYPKAEGNFTGAPARAAELMRLKVDIIVTGGPQSTRAAKEATVTIPIVMTNEADPVGTGFVASLARPGGNITGLSTLAPELSGKQLEILKETIPKLSRVAVVGTSSNPGYARVLKEIELAAGALKVQLQHLDVLDAKDIETAFRAASKGRAQAVLVLGSPVVSSHRKQVEPSR
jgi:putative ABC transport system substrate-binding protein